MTVEFEKPVTVRILSEMTGRTMSEGAIRAACWRAPDEHPLPHVRSGEKRPILLVRPSVFSRWYEEEELRNVRIAVDGGAGVGA